MVLVIFNAFNNFRHHDHLRCIWIGYIAYAKTSHDLPFFPA